MRRPTPPRPSWRRSWGHSPGSKPTATRCCGGFAIIGVTPIKPRESYEGLSVTPVGIDEQCCPDYLLQAARHECDRMLELGEKHGFRNAQVTVIAPTGTIALVMDCDTTGVEPDFALVKFKKLAGGGYFKIINRAVPEALRVLGYSEAQIAEIEAYVVGHG